MFLLNSKKINKKYVKKAKHLTNTLTISRSNLLLGNKKPFLFIKP
jgi:hypothetical protein